MKKIFLFVILLLVTSCGGAPESQKTFESVMKSLQSGDYKEIVKTMKDDIGFENAENSFSTMSFYSEHFKKVKYKIIETKEEKEKSTIKISIEAPNLFNYLPNIFRELMGLAFSGASEEVMAETINNSFLDVLKTKDLKYIKKELTVIMIKKDNKWVFDRENPDNKEFFSILIGGMDKANNTDNQAETENEAETVETKFFKKGERGVITLTAQTLLSVDIARSSYHEVKEGNELIVIKLMKENISQEVVPGSDFNQYQIETKDGQLIKPTIIGDFSNYSYDDLPVGNKVEQTLAYEVPKGSAKNLLIIDNGVKYASYDLGL